jgi:hypothetical protein
MPKKNKWEYVLEFGVSNMPKQKPITDFNSIQYLCQIRSVHVGVDSCHDQGTYLRVRKVS